LIILHPDFEDLLGFYFLPLRREGAVLMFCYLIILLADFGDLLRFYFLPQRRNGAALMFLLFDYFAPRF
jgi:hypothetical protein